MLMIIILILVLVLVFRGTAPEVEEKAKDVPAIVEEELPAEEVAEEEEYENMLRE